MISIIITFLRAHWISASIAASGFSIFAVVAFQHLEIESLRKKVNESDARNITLINANDALAASIRRQNDAINALNDNAESNKKSALLAREKAEKLAQRYRAQADKIQSMVLTGNGCTDIQTIVHSYIGSKH